MLRSWKGLLVVIRRCQRRPPKMSSSNAFPQSICRRPVSTLTFWEQNDGQGDFASSRFESRSFPVSSSCVGFGQLLVCIAGPFNFFLNSSWLCSERVSIPPSWREISCYCRFVLPFAPDCTFFCETTRGSDKKWLFTSCWHSCKTFARSLCRWTSSLLSSSPENPSSKLASS